MAGIPKYIITSCCEQFVSSGTFNIPGIGTITNDLYVFNGPSFTEPTTGMAFIAGYCYQITYLGVDIVSQPVAFNSTDITLVPGAKTCAGAAESSACIACELAIPAAYEIFACCDTDNITTVNIDIEACSVVGNVWTYTGTGYTTSSGFVFNTGDCYQVSRLLEGWYEPGPACTDFDFVAVNTCSEAEVAEACPACSPSLKYLAFTSCCDDVTILFKGIDADSYYGVKEYLGTAVDGLINKCYSIIIGDVGDITVPDVEAYNLLPEPPVYIEGSTFSNISIYSTDCTEFVESCPECKVVCYRLYSCDGQIFNTTVDLSLYVGQFISLVDALGAPILGTWFVTINNVKCADAIEDIAFSAVVTACDPQCYEVTGTSKVTYLDYNLNIQTVFAPLKFCSYIYPQVSGIYTINSFGTCTINEDETLDCPDLCFTLTNCLTNVVYNSNTQLLTQYVGEIVTINGYDGCWQVELNEGVCDCPINVTVLQNYATCEECLPIVAYKFTNCLNPLQVQYSDLDYSEYVGLSVQLSCGQCWFVEEIDYTPPSIQTITILYTFDNCEACARTYYKLEDCNGIEDDVYTYTDLSTYAALEQVIKIAGCDTCWLVTTTRDLVTPAGIVTFEVAYDDCIDCGNASPCVCNSIRNDQDVPTAFQYVDCTGTTQTTPLLDPGKTSLRYCLRAWKNDAELNNYVKSYGECVEGVCPPMTYNVRSVKPGYNTPGCSADKYDTISCKSSQILYRQVLTLRYGISNCCPEEDEYWLVKKELIDIAALYNPAYPCKAPGCGCGCNNCNDNSCNECRTCNS